MEDNDKMCLAYFQSNMEYYRRVETWGSTFFTTGILVLGKFWNESYGNNYNCTAWVIFTAGLVGFVFLRIVNMRGFEERKKIMLLLCIEQQKKLLGAMGWFFALAPLVLGCVLACMFILPPGDKWIFILIGVVVLLTGMVVHVRKRM